MAMKLHDLPDEILSKIFFFAAPEAKSKCFLWVSGIGRTCKLFRALAIDLAPKLATTLIMPDVCDNGLERIEKCGWHVSYRVKDPGAIYVKPIPMLIQSISDIPWRRNALVELHIDGGSILEPPMYSSGSWSTFGALQRLLAKPGALPHLKWLDINISGHQPCKREAFPLAGQYFFERLPSALPNLSKLCLAFCFKKNEVAPSILAKFARRVHLSAVSFAGCKWFRDEHAIALIDISGSNLTCLELRKCGNTRALGPPTIDKIRQKCQSLISLSFCQSPFNHHLFNFIDIAHANQRLQHLDIFSNLRHTPSIVPNDLQMIRKFLPQLQTFRANYSKWFDDDYLHALVSVSTDPDDTRTHVKSTSLRVIGLAKTRVTAEGLWAALRYERWLGVCNKGGFVELDEPTIGILQRGIMYERLGGLDITEDDHVTWTSIGIRFPDVCFRVVNPDFPMGSCSVFHK